MLANTFKFCLLITVLLLGEVVVAQTLPAQVTLFPLGDHSFRKNFGITDQAQTFIVPLSPNKNKQFLVIENPHINILRGRAKFLDTAIITGDQFSFFKRPVSHRFFVIPIPPLVNSDTLVLNLDKAGENLSFTAQRMEASQYERYLKKDTLIIGGVLGFYALAIVLAFLLVGIFNSTRFFFFAAFVFFSLCWILNDAGLFYETLWPDSPVWHKSSRGLFSSLTMVLFALYLRQQKNAMLRKGIGQVAVSIAVLLTFKFLLAFVVAAGLFPNSLKYITMYINSWGLLILFGYVFISLLRVLRQFPHDRNEIFGILTYCVFVLNLAIRELGFDLVSLNGFHQFEVMLFFPLQCYFMAAQLYQEVQDERKNAARALVDLKVNQQREFDSKLLSIEMGEKKKIARNLHDEIGGIFIALKYRLLLLKQQLSEGLREEDLTEISNLADYGVKKQHEIIEELISGYNGDRNLQDTIRSHINMISKGTILNIKFDYSVSEKNWSAFQKAQVFRITAELLNNVVKHAEATSVLLRFEGEKQLKISYEDNGKGFDWQHVQEGRGLSNIRQRVTSLQGAMETSSCPGQTHYYITIPLTYA